MMIFLARTIDVTILLGTLFKLWSSSKYSHVVIH